MRSLRIRKGDNRIVDLESLEPRVLLAANGAEASWVRSETHGVYAVQATDEGVVPVGEVHPDHEEHELSGAQITVGDYAVEPDDVELAPPLMNYTLTGHKWPDSRLPISYYVNTANLPAGINEADYISAVDGAFQAWEDVPTATIRFNKIGSGTQYGMSTGDGVATVGFGTATAGALAHATWSYDGSGIVDFDVVLGDDRASWSTSPGGGQADVWATTTHEVGHGIGLGHTPDTNASMYQAIFLGSTHQRDPNSDDIAGIEQLYPAPVNELPPTPGELSASNVVPTEATISWGPSVDPDGDAVTYDLQYRKDDLSDDWSSVQSTSNTMLTITGLEQLTSYRVRVRANDGIGASDWREASNLFATPPFNQPPTQPGTLTTADVLQHQASIRWGASIDSDNDPLTYEVQYRKDDLSDSWSNTFTTSSTMILLTGLLNDTTYRVQVRASDGVATSSWRSSTKLFTTHPYLPAFPFGEFGKLDGVTHVVRFVSLSRSYHNPVVFALPASTNGQQAAVVRLRAVQSDRFSVFLAESSGEDGIHGDESITYLVLEAGTHQLEDGTRLEVGTVSTSATVGGQIDNVWESVTFTDGWFEGVTPVVLTQPQSNAGDDYLSTRQTNLSSLGFDVALEPDEAATSQQVAEMIGFLAIEPGVHATGSVLLEANYTGHSVTDQWYDQAFSRQYVSEPGFLASLASYNGSDNSHIRYQALDGDGVQVKVGEDSWFDMETKHTAEEVSYVVIGGAGYLTATVAQLDIGQFGVINDVTNVPQTIVLDKTFVSPVVFAQSVSGNGGQPAVVRVNNILPDRFSIYLAEPSNEDGVHGAETVSFLVLEAGVHELADGRRLEVGTRVTGASVGLMVVDQWETFHFADSFDSVPVVLTQIQTDAGRDYLMTRHSNISAAGMRLALQQEEAISSQHTPETVGYLAIESGSGIWNGHVFAAAATAAVVTEDWQKVNFSRTFSTTPVLLSSMSSYWGKDSVHVRYRDLTSSDVEFKSGEDTTFDTELLHAEESVAYLAIDGSGMLSATITQLGIGEVGQIPNLTNVPQEVLLENTYLAPVVFSQSPTANGGQPVVTRVDNVQSDRFSIYLAEPSNEDGVHGEEVVSYLVFESGVHQLADGTRLEVGTRTTGATVGQLVVDQWETMTFTQPFAQTPVVLSQIQTVSGDAYLTTRHNNVGNSGFMVGLHPEEAVSAQHVPETIGYVAMDMRRGVWNGRVFEAGRSNTNVSEVATAVSFAAGFDSVPTLLSNMDSYFGKDSAHVRYRDLTQSSVKFQVGEDTTVDTELIHAVERVAFFAIDGNGTLTANAPTAAPVVAQVVRDGGDDSAASLDTLSFKFDLPVNVAVEDLSLENSSAGETLVSLAGVLFQYDALTQTATWRFGAVPGIGPGFYTAVLDSNAVTSLAGIPLDGDGNGTGGDDFATRQLVAHPGDTNLDGDVDIQDFNMLAVHYDPLGVQAKVGWSSGNFDGDDDVDIRDFSLLARNFFPLGYGVTLPAGGSVRSTIALSSDSAFSMFAGLGRESDGRISDLIWDTVVHQPPHSVRPQQGFAQFEWIVDQPPTVSGARHPATALQHLKGKVFKTSRHWCG